MKRLKLELHLAAWEGLVLHGSGAVAAQHHDVQFLVPGMSILVVLMHYHQIEVTIRVTWRSQSYRCLPATETFSRENNQLF